MPPFEDQHYHNSRRLFVNPRFFVHFQQDIFHLVNQQKPSLIEFNYFNNNTNSFKFLIESNYLD